MPRRRILFCRVVRLSPGRSAAPPLLTGGFRLPRVHQVIAKLDEGELFAEWCRQRRLVGLRSYDDSFVVADDHRPVLEPWATPRGLGSGSSLVDGIEVADQNVAVLRAPLPEVIGNDSKLPAWSLLVDEFRHAVTSSAVLLPSTSEPKVSIEYRYQDNHTK